MARTAVVRELGRLMIRVLRCNEVGPMTGKAIIRRPGKPCVLMTRVAVDCKMGPGELEICLLMVKYRRHPPIDGVASGAVV